MKISERPLCTLPKPYRDFRKIYIEDGGIYTECKPQCQQNKNKVKCRQLKVNLNKYQNQQIVGKQSGEIKLLSLCCKIYIMFNLFFKAYLNKKRFGF